jgi:hypothetical protein
VARGKRRRRRFADGETLVARRGRALAAEQPLHALVDDKALGAEQRGEHDDLIGPPHRDASRCAEHVPHEAEVADVAGGGEHPVGHRVAAQDLELRVGPFVEPVDDRAEV